MFSAEQERKLDDAARELAPMIHEPMAALVKEFAEAVMVEKFGEVWDTAELAAAQVRVNVVTEKDVARELTSRLMLLLLNPHALT